ncbi:PaaI family thioesterase [Sphingomonas oryzagri]|uniref:PaaI family thioesterase n=1 Tax=Sphingomonas oryzagri TaxID=3042314 RepID=A0ABT6MYD4_9SPHN|nr:PaaI family thioesterase [Sphingomonas oryzagri]MDH7638063.1 PaaI family thioesterase [Sphingomonas oryzagri]
MASDPYNNDEGVRMNVIEESAGTLSGIEQLRALKAAGRRPPIADTLDFDLAEIEKGRVVFAGVPGANALNPIGSIHGGYAATLLDSACGCAAHTMLSSTQGYTTLELKVSYHRALKPGGEPVRAEGVVLSIGRRTAFVEAKLVDGQGKLCASATSTLLVFDLPS